MIDLNEQEYATLKALSESEEWCYAYDYLEGETGLERKWLKPIIAKLRKLGYVEYWRGLMDDDGNVAGSGFCRSRAGNELVYAEEDRKYEKLKSERLASQKASTPPPQPLKLVRGISDGRNIK